jgi:hypothetical protein
VPFLHCARDKVIRDQARTMLYMEPREDEHSGRDIGQNWKNKWNKVPTHKEGTMSGKQDIQQDLQEGCQLEVMKQIVGTFIRLQKMNVQTLWRSQPPLK